MVRGWFPQLYDTKLIRPTWGDIAKHHEYLADLVGVVPVSVIHQRLTDEAGLEVSVASLRRYVRARFAEDVRRGEVVIWRPPVEPGDEAQVDYGYLGTWRDPRRRAGMRLDGAQLLRHLFVYPVLVMTAASVRAHAEAFSFYGSLEAAATAGYGRSRWCSASPAICSCTRSW